LAVNGSIFFLQIRAISTEKLEAEGGKGKFGKLPLSRGCQLEKPFAGAESRRSLSLGKGGERGGSPLKGK